MPKNLGDPRIDDLPGRLLWMAGEVENVRLVGALFLDVHEIVEPTKTNSQNPGFLRRGSEKIKQGQARNPKKKLHYECNM